jgi:excisionase family DNA binding protein
MVYTLPMSQEIMTLEEVAKYLDLAETTIYKKVEMREIPFTKIGHLLRFPKKFIDQWLAENTVPAVTSLFEEFSRLFSRFHFKKWLESKGVNPEKLTDAELLALAKKAIEDLQSAAKGEEPEILRQISPEYWIGSSKPGPKKGSTRKKHPTGKARSKSK